MARVGSSGSDRACILWSAVGTARVVPPAVADLVRRESEGADADPARRERLPDADRRQRDVVYGAEEAQRSRRARAVSAIEPWVVAHGRAVAAGGSSGTAPQLVRVLADRSAGASVDGAISSWADTQ